VVWQSGLTQTHNGFRFRRYLRFFPGKDKQFFFEKKNQKTFARLGKGCIQRVPQWAKVFASFFKKKRFPVLFWTALANSGDQNAPRWAFPNP
jgi:hypothetical protein